MPVVVLALAAAALASQPNPAKLILKPGAVGPGYAIAIAPGGLGAKERTLDLCGTTNYPSEALRTARIQVDYGKPNAKLALSNEVVVYKGSGAAQAMHEVAQHATNCPAKPIAFEGQPPLRYKITRIADAKLLSGSLALRIDVSGKVKGKPVHVIRFAIYQRAGHVLSGVYSYAADSSVSGAAQEKFVLHAAEASAKALRSTATQGGLPA
jgi:hypothetical protein